MSTWVLPSRDGTDTDGDGACDPGDCMPNDPAIFQGFPEVCGDGIDNDCNPGTPDLFDSDTDGFDCSIDCDDGDSSVNPGAVEILCDGIDQNCAPLDDAPNADNDGHDVCDPGVPGDGDFLPADCDDNDPGAFAPPGEVTGLSFSDEVTLSWGSAIPGAGFATVHHVVRGMLAELPVGSGISETCLAPGGTPNDSATDPSTPASGTGYWDLVRGRNGCGSSTYGTESGGAERVTSVCP